MRECIEKNMLTLQSASPQALVTVPIEQGRVRMKVLSEEQIETLSSSTTGVHLNFFMATVGIDAGLLTAILSGGITEAYLPYFNIALLILLFVTLYFLMMSIVGSIKKSRVKNAIMTRSKAIDIRAPNPPSVIGLKTKRIKRPVDLAR